MANAKQQRNAADRSKRKPPPKPKPAPSFLQHLTSNGPSKKQSSKTHHDGMGKSGQQRRSR